MPRRAEDGQVVARADVVLRAEVYEDDLVAREHLAPVARENDVSGLLAGRLSEAVNVLAGKAAPEEVEDYKRFTLNIAQRVAEAHKEQGTSVSAEERDAIAKIESTLGRKREGEFQ